MAKLVKTASKIEEVKKEYFLRNIQAEENRRRENQAAMQIQSWFRACKVRTYLSHLHKKATIIQKIWRSFAARARVRQMVKEAYFIMKMNFYQAMAVRIQCRWRGYYVRKYIHNFYARKRYLDGLAMKNEQVKNGLDEVEELQKIERERLERKREQKAKVKQARLHYLLSTKQCPGVYNSPFRPAPHEMELLLRKAKPQLSTRFSPKGRALLPNRPNPTVPSSPGASGSQWIKTTNTCCTSGSRLPPIARCKPQGPFRRPEDWWKQRLCCAEPSLRVQTSYIHQEEAWQEELRRQFTGQLQDTLFLPFTKAHQRNMKYERQLHSSTSFPPLAYGSKYFREEDKHELKEKEPFKTVFTTCNVFDKFDRLYSKAGNIV
ncbi:spermatogenesis-associated protein 17 [Lampris incognitus]|uniref:spermatogenesis-associated protein 17 n=1 Tax=Lampris incognitus TaxID=2546036 RepID=UPI0024B5430D|nr:spermatogenesis-associated protein 17 [Lampris incognitus]